jgi:dienelactone hydrolase
LKTISSHFNPQTEIEPRINSVTQHLHQNGIEQIYLLGFCWGGWVGAHLLSGPTARHYQCMAIGHPSCSLEEWAFGRDTQALIDGVTKPLLFMPAKGDPDQYRQSGSYFQSIHSRCSSSQTVDFAEQEHGFIPRSDISVPENKAAVDKALDTVVAFFDKHQ